MEVTDLLGITLPGFLGSRLKSFDADENETRHAANGRFAEGSL
jgi:hypothetical protein